MSASAKPAPLLVASGLHRRYRLPKTSVRGPHLERHALNGIDLDIAEYSSVGVVGESGSGKSTLVRILLGLDRPKERSPIGDARSFPAARPASAGTAAKHRSCCRTHSARSTRG